MEKISKQVQMACSECRIICGCLGEDLKKRVPSEFFDFLNKNSLPGYVPNFDLSQPIEKQKLLPETSALISAMYLKYLCDNDEERLKFAGLLK